MVCRRASSGFFAAAAPPKMLCSAAPLLPALPERFWVRLLAAGFRLLISVPQKVSDSSKKFFNIDGLEENAITIVIGTIHRVLGGVAGEQNTGQNGIA